MPHACHRFWKCYKTLTFCSLLTRHNPLRLPRESTSERPKMLRAPQIFALLIRNVLRATAACNFSTSQLPNVVRTPSAFNILTWKCALRHNGVHFFDIATSKSGPELVCFVHVDFEMCFAPQRCAIFHLSSSQMAPHPPL